MTTPRDTSEAEIRQQISKIAGGIRAQDLAGLKRLYAPDVVSFDVEPPLQHVGVDAKLKNWRGSSRPSRMCPTRFAT